MTQADGHKQVLVVDDDEALLSFLKQALERAGYEALLASDGEKALDLAIEQPPDLIVLDLYLPGRSGLEILGELRRWCRSPVLVLSGRGEEDTIVDALDLGADEYIIKPISPRELMARVRSLLRRFETSSRGEAALLVGDLKIDFARRRLYRADQEIRLTRTEFEIVSYLARHVNCVITFSMLMDHIWGPNHGNYCQAVRVHIGNIRRKLEPDRSAPSYILTEAGVGYRFSAPPSLDEAVA